MKLLPHLLDCLLACYATSDKRACGLSLNLPSQLRSMLYAAILTPAQGSAGFTSHIPDRRTWQDDHCVPCQKQCEEVLERCCGDVEERKSHEHVRNHQ